MRRLWALGLLLLALPALAAVQGKEVSYQGGGVTMKGYLAWDDASQDKRPGVLVVHEWWGHDDYARKRARLLAQAGYVALALDMYGNGRHAEHPDTAEAYTREVTQNPAQAAQRFEAAMQVLRQDAHTDPARIAAIGYCFGGGVVLNMARRGEPLKAAISVHGGLDAWQPAKPGAITARLLVLNAGEDRMVPAAAVSKFEQEMKAAGADFQIVNYPGVLHGFSNPAADDYAKRFKLPVAYDAKADQDSWRRILAFLQQVFTAHARPAGA